jgi:hypothetical protein
MAYNTSVPELYSAIEPYILEMLKKAPEYGSCGIDLTLHCGRLVKIELRNGINLKPGKDEPDKK